MIVSSLPELSTKHHSKSINKLIILKWSAGTDRSTIIKFGKYQQKLDKQNLLEHELKTVSGPMSIHGGEGEADFLWKARVTIYERLQDIFEPKRLLFLEVKFQ